MKKWIKKIVAPALVVAASMGLSACSFFEKEQDKSGYIFSNYDNTYYVNEDFVINGTILKITDKNGVETEVEVTRSMIKNMPDMTTSGTKKIVVVYNGVEYTFTIKVENRPANVLTDKLQEFLSKYESGKASSMHANVVTNIDAKYFNQKADADYYKDLDVTSEDFSEDRLTNTIYNAIFDAIVEGSFNIGAENIISAEDMKAKLDTIKTAEKVESTISEFDMFDYILDKMLPESDEYYINKIGEFICDNTDITSRNGKLSINNVVRNYYFKLKELEKFELRDLYVDLISTINGYTDNYVVKEVTAHIENLDIDELSNLLSDLIYVQSLNECKVMTVDNWAKHWINNEEAVFETSAVATNLIKQQANARKALVRSQEVAIKNLLEGKDVKQTILDSIQASIDYATNVYSITAMCKSKQWVICTNDGDDWYSPEISWHVEWVNWDEQNVVMYYDDTMDTCSIIKDYATDVYNLIDTGDIEKAIRDYQLVELAVDEMLITNGIIAEENRDEVVDKIYNIIDTKMTGKELYNEILSIVLTEEDSYYIDVAVDFVANWTMIDTLSGKMELEEVITNYYYKLKNAESFDVKQALIDIFTVVNSYTTDEMVRTATDSLKTMELEQLAHIISDVRYVYCTNNVEILPVEHFSNPWEVGKIDQYFVDNAQSLDIIGKYANNEQKLIKIFEGAILDLATTTSVEEFKNIVLDVTSNLEEYYNIHIGILEDLKHNDWVICEFDDDGYIYPLVDYYYRNTSTGYKAVPNWDYDINCAQENADGYAMAYDYIDLAWKMITDIEGATRDLADMYRSEIAEYVMSVTGEIVNPESDLYAEIETLVNDVIDDYVNDAIDFDTITSEIDRMITEYAHEDGKTVAKALHMFVMSFGYDEETDYNEIFKDIELPYQIESVDYNQLMKKLFDENTYDAFTFSDVEVEYLTDAEGEIIGESLTLVVDVNFDAIIASLVGNVKINLVLDFKG